MDYMAEAVDVYGYENVHYMYYNCPQNDWRLLRLPHLDRLKMSTVFFITYNNHENDFHFDSEPLVQVMDKDCNSLVIQEWVKDQWWRLDPLVQKEIKDHEITNPWTYGAEGDYVVCKEHKLWLITEQYTYPYYDWNPIHTRQIFAVNEINVNSRLFSVKCANKHDTPTLWLAIDDIIDVIKKDDYNKLHHYRDQLSEAQSFIQIEYDEDIFENQPDPNYIINESKLLKQMYNNILKHQLTRKISACVNKWQFRKGNRNVIKIHVESHFFKQYFIKEINLPFEKDNNLGIIFNWTYSNVRTVIPAKYILKKYNQKRCGYECSYIKLYKVQGQYPKYNINNFLYLRVLVKRLIIIKTNNQSNVRVEKYFDDNDWVKQVKY